MGELDIEQILTMLVPVVVSVFSLVSAFVPDEKMPGWIAKVVNMLALNVGKAKNAPGQ